MAPAGPPSSSTRSMDIQVRFHPRRAVFLLSPAAASRVIFKSRRRRGSEGEAALITADEINQGNLIANAGSRDEPSSSSLSHAASEG